MKGLKWFASAAIAVVVGVFIMPVVFMIAIISSAEAEEYFAVASSGTCEPVFTDRLPIGQGGTETVRYMDEIQMANASIIVGAAKRRGMADQAGLLGVMTAMQESNLRILANDGSAAVPAGWDEQKAAEFRSWMAAIKASMSHPNKQGVGSDFDSIGLFQQRPSAGWGSIEELMDPVTSANRFYDRLEKVEGWDTRKDLSEVISDVQRPAEQYRSAYGKHAEAAKQIVRAVGEGCKPAEESAPGDSEVPVVNGLANPLSGRMTSPFGAPRGGYTHMGQDIAAPLGSQIRSAAKGTVERASCHAFSGRSPCNIIVDHGSFKTWYVHMFNDGVLVNVGQTVSAGQVIAKVGNNGRSSGPHLHFEVHLNGKAIDPVKFYRDNGTELGK